MRIFRTSIHLIAAAFLLALSTPIAFANPGDEPSICERALLTGYSRAVTHAFSHERFLDGNRPACDAPYCLSARLAEFDSHASQAVRLGFRTDVDRFGNSVLLPPLSPHTIFKNYRDLVAAVDRSKTIIPVIVFLRTGVTEMTQRLEDYFFMDPTTDPWPSSEEWTLASSVVPDVGLPVAVWYPTLAAGMIPLPFGNLFEHEMGHLTEFSSDLVLMSETRAYYQSAFLQPAIWNYQAPDYQNATYVLHRRRMFSVTEFFSVPDIAQRALMEEVFPGLFAQAGSAAEVFAGFKASLSELLPDELLNRIDRIFQTQWSLFLRQGGASRDTYNLQARMKPWYLARKRMQLARTSVAFEDPHQYRDSNGPPSANETLFGMAAELSVLLQFYRYPTEEMRIQSRGGIESDTNEGRFSGTEAEFQQEVLARIIDIIARIQSASYWAVRLSITPSVIVHDAGQTRVSRNSPTYRYLDAFLPDDSYLRRVFLSEEASTE